MKSEYAEIFKQHGISAILDTFAGKHNGTGLSGKYLSESTVEEYAKNSGLQIMELKE